MHTMKKGNTPKPKPQIEKKYTQKILQKKTL
jgi:hypothetical protein